MPAITTHGREGTLSAIAVVLLAIALFVALPARADRARSAMKPNTTVPRTGERPKHGTSLAVAIYARDQSALAEWNADSPALAAGIPLARTSGAPGRRWFLAVERARQIKLSAAVRRATRGVASSQSRIAQLVQSNGGSVSSTLPTPNIVYARIPTLAFDSIASSLLVQAVEPLGMREYHGVTDASGASAWHAAGCSAGGGADTCPATSWPSSVTAPQASPDADGGPDFAVDDQGINNHHDAFTGGATAALGRSPAIVKPAGSPATNGSLHANTIASIVGVKDPGHLGVAFGVDKLLDPTSPGVASSTWMLGIPHGGVVGATDLPESINKSYGLSLFNTVDDSSENREADMEVSQYGIAGSGSAGNDGPYPPQSSTLRSEAQQKRVSHPCVAFNVVCVGAVTPNGAGADDDTVAPYSSRGPTVGGRKKPDLVARNGGAFGCPDGSSSSVDDTLWRPGSQCGEGTSYAAPFAAGGQLLLSGVGVTSPMAQKAILINSALALDSESDSDTIAQSYWSPDIGWGEIDLADAYEDRANFRIGQVGPYAANNAAFFRIDGQAVGARTTLAWNRRAIVTNSANLSTVGYTTTDLDLFQIALDGSDGDQDVCGTSSTCGVDASENSDTGPTASTGGVVTRWPAADTGTDTVEQVRAASSGSSLVKVKASTEIDGAATELFAVASTDPLVPLESPTITAPPAQISDTLASVNQDVTVTAALTNNSSGIDLQEGLDLESVLATIQLPAGTQLVAGPASQPLGTLDTDETDSAEWTVRGTTSSVKQIGVVATGQRFGETFSTTAPFAALTVDSDPPSIALGAPSGWQGQRTNSIDWTASDALSSVANIEVQRSVDGSAFATIYNGASAASSALVTGDEGQTVTIRVRATDANGNVSPYSPASWQIDAEAPALTVVAPKLVYYGDPANVETTPANVGSAVAISYATSLTYPARTPLAGHSFSIPTVENRGHPFEIWIYAVDAVGRTTERRIEIDTRPRPSSFTREITRRRGTSRLRLAPRPKLKGLFTVKGRCGSRRVEHYPYTSGAAVSVGLPRKSSRCSLRIKFEPVDGYAFAPSTRMLLPRRARRAG